MQSPTSPSDSPTPSKKGGDGLKSSILSIGEEKQVRELVKRAEEDRAWKMWNRYKYRLAKEEGRAKRGEYDASTITQTRGKPK
jgi:hypothetical protein